MTPDPNGTTTSPGPAAAGHAPSSASTRYVPVDDASPRHQTDWLANVWSAQRWLSVLRRQALVILCVFLIVLAIGVAVLIALPKRYESVTTFLVKNARQQLVVDPNDRTSAVYSDAVSEETINSESELLKSPDVLAKVVVDVGLAGTPGESSDARAIEAEVSRLSRALDVEPIKKTNLLRVAYRDVSASRARDVLNTLASAYLSSHVTLHSTPGADAVFHTRSGEAREELQLAEERLSRMARSSGLVDPDAQRSSLLQQKLATEGEYQSLLAEIEMQRARERTAVRLDSSIVARIETTRRESQMAGAVGELTQLQVELRNRRTELLTKFQDDDRLVRELDAKLENVEQALLSARGLSVSENATDVNPASQLLKTEALSAAVSVAALEGKAAQLRRLIQSHDQEISSLVEATPKFESVARDVADARARYGLYVKREEEASLSAALDARNIGNVVVVQSPSVASAPSSPNMSAGVVAVVLFAGIAALLAGIASELASLSLRFKLAPLFSASPNRVRS